MQVVLSVEVFFPESVRAGVKPNWQFSSLVMPNARMDSYLIKTVFDSVNALSA